jgi:electron transfer flavoprotein alpha subunit
VAEVVVFVEQREGQVKKAALEVIAQGRAAATAWGGSLEAILLGTGLQTAAADLIAFGPDLVTVMEHPQLAHYTPDGDVQALSPRIRDAQAVFLSATALGRDLAPRLAARLRAGLASDCTGLTVNPDRSLQAVRPVYSGKAMATVEFSDARPILVTLRPNVFPPAVPVPEPKGEVVKEPVEIDESKVRARWVDLNQDEGAELDVTEADIVVAGGRAMGNSESFQVIRDLAEALGGAVGASRAAVDADYIAHQHQVGQTGKVVSPKLYIACGISGAIQHLAGMSSSKVIVAINKDPEAPIFKVATYGLVGDLFKIVPMLTEKIRKLKAE